MGKRLMRFVVLQLVSMHQVRNMSKQKVLRALTLMQIAVLPLMAFLEGKWEKPLQFNYSS